DQIGVGRGSVGGLPELRAVGATALWPVVGREEEGTSHVGQVAGIASSGGADVLDQVRVGVGSVGGHPQLSGVRAAALHPVEGGEEEGAADIGQLLGTAGSSGVYVLHQTGVGRRSVGGSPELDAVLGGFGTVVCGEEQGAPHVGQMIGVAAGGSVD